MKVESYARIHALRAAFEHARHMMRLFPVPFWLLAATGARRKKPQEKWCPYCGESKVWKKMELFDHIMAEHLTGGRLERRQYTYRRLLMELLARDCPEDAEVWTQSTIYRADTEEPERDRVYNVKYRKGIVTIFGSEDL